MCISKNIAKHLNDLENSIEILCNWQLDDELFIKIKNEYKTNNNINKTIKNNIDIIGSCGTIEFIIIKNKIQNIQQLKLTNLQIEQILNYYKNIHEKGINVYVEKEQKNICIGKLFILYKLLLMINIDYEGLFLSLQKNKKYNQNCLIWDKIMFFYNNN